jgi:hypothetical protein
MRVINGTDHLLTSFAHFFESNLFIIFFSLFADQGDAPSQFVNRLECLANI